MDYTDADSAVSNLRDEAKRWIKELSNHDVNRDEDGFPIRPKRCKHWHRADDDIFCSHCMCGEIKKVLMAFFDINDEELEE